MNERPTKKTCQADACDELTESETGYCWRHRTEASRPGYQPAYRDGTKTAKKQKPLKPIARP
jgi:hypothetical protein